MSRGIFLINEKNEPVEMREERYDSEALLQRLLADHPAILAGDQIDRQNPRRWLFVSQEMSLSSEEDGSGRWSIDHLFIDQDAVPTIIEVKRSTDTRIRREVVGQMLEYAANAVVYWPVESLRAKFDMQCEKRGKSSEEALNEFLGEGQGADAFWQNVKTNLQAGRVRLVFVADEIPSELRRIVEFLNEQMDPAEVLAVEIKQYVSGSLRTLVPSVIGQTQEAQQRKSTGTSSSRPTRQWDEASFFEDMGTKLAESDVSLARELLGWAKTHGTQVRWGNGPQYAAFVSVVEHAEETYSLFLCYNAGNVEIQFSRLKEKSAFKDTARRLALLNRLNAISGVSIPDSKITGMPSIKFSVLAQGTALTEFLAVMDWLMEEIRKYPAPSDSDAPS